MGDGSAPLAPPADVARLERRLRREREARLAAEAIAEKGLRELYDHQRRLQLLETIATAANQSASPGRVLQFALEQVCDFAGWPLAHLYLVRLRGGARVVPTRVWHGGEQPRHAAFRRDTERLRLVAGHGLPGRVLATGEPAWIADLADDPNFPRADAALACGLRSALAFPVLVGREVVAVLEFFAEVPREPDDELLRLMAQVGAQLGRVIERGRADRRLRQSNRKLQRMVEEAEAQRNAAEAASRAKSAFLAVTSHEVRTPLNAVLGLTEALMREPLTERQADLTQGVLDSGAMLLRLLNAVLDLSRIEAGEQTLALAPFDLARTAETAVRIWRPSAEGRGLRLELDLSALPRPCVLTSDEGKIEQTLVNLISNAVKFSPPGGRVGVSVSGGVDGDRCAVRVEVTDQGPGVPVEDRARIFRPFEQTPVGREAGGAGLGLSICAGNVALLGGRIGADGAPQTGGRFWFEFAAELHDAASETAQTELGPVGELPLRVLAAEDNPANRKVLEALLEPAGVALEFVENGEAAVAAVARASFDLVLMDVNMPVMDGVTALRAIRARESDGGQRLIYMLTANAFEEDVQRYLGAGADGVLRKPIVLAELYAALGHAADAALAA